MLDPIVTTISVMGSIASVIQLFESRYGMNDVISAEESKRLLHSATKSSHGIGQKMEEEQFQLSNRSRRLIEKIKDQVDETWGVLQDHVLSAGPVDRARLDRVAHCKERICWFLKQWADLGELPEDFRQLRAELDCAGLSL